jgi:N-acetylglucosamine kinase-like BadF-type ATPase
MSAARHQTAAGSVGSVSLLVDGGGSTTRVALWRAGDGAPWAQRTGPSCNPRSVGATAAARNLDEQLSAAWADRPPEVEHPAAVWLCLSTVSTPDSLDDLAAQLLSRPGSPVRHARDLWITNDVTPLLVHDGTVADRVAVIAGTGTGFCAVNVAAGLTARASGREYLLADEGGGFDVGQRGLRAVVRDTDGRGPRTLLSDMLAAWAPVSVDGLMDFVHASVEPKILIASFAPTVLAAAEAGDAVALSIVESAAAELAAGVVAVADRAQLTEAFEVLFVGSVLLGDHPVLRRRVEDTLVQKLPAASLRPLTTPTLSCVRHLADLLPGDPRLVGLLGGCVPLWHRTGRAEEDRQAEPAVTVERGNSRFELAPVRRCCPVTRSSRRRWTASSAPSPTTSAAPMRSGSTAEPTR